MGVERTPRAAYAHFLPLATRWMDNDVYGHVNNVQYYSYFDTAVNHYLITSGWLDIHNGEVVYEGTAEELVNDPKAREIYLGPDFIL